MHTHAISYESSTDPLSSLDIGYAAFCECGWRGDWHHADTQATWPDDPEVSAGLAEDLAQFDADEHLDEVAPAPDLGAFRALGGPPAVDPSGYAAATAARQPS